MRRGHTAAAAACAGVCAALLATGCGGTRQDAREPDKTFDMRVLSATFPAKQALAKPATMRIVVSNTGEHAVPNVAVTVDAFNYASQVKELAANKRPVWAIEQGPGSNARPPVESQEVSQPGSGVTAYVNTWALGPLAAKQTRTFRWVVMPVKAGTHVVHYSVAAGLAGRSRAQASKGSLSGQFEVKIAAKPPSRHVNPNTGKVVPGPAPPISSP